MIKNISGKLLNATIIGFVIAVVIEILSGVNTILYLKNFGNDMSWMRDNEIAGRNYILTSKIYLRDLDREIKNFLLARDDEEKNKSVTAVNNAKSRLIQNLMRARPLFYTKNGKQLIDQTIFTAESLSRESELIIAFGDSGKDEANDRAFGKFQLEIAVLDDTLVKLENIKSASDSAIYRKLIKSQKITIISVMVILGATLIFRVVVTIHNHKKSRRKKPEIESEEFII
jgi:methyl-accepting chemotaxis protein